tara:strand:+ start:1255 stop:2109 length:855 start_codon:yes stop_codon:yes gene_type:complete
MKLEDKRINNLTNLKFGIVQGRLLKSPTGKLQWFPETNWEDEFIIAASLGIDNIELIADREFNSKNPIWSEKGIQKIRKLSIENNVKVNTICNDHIINYDLHENIDLLNQNLDLIKIGVKLNCNKFILPFFEKSELNISNYTKYIEYIKIIAETCEKSNIVLCLETILNAKDLLYILRKINIDNIKVVFDTGNRIAFGHNIYEDLMLLGNKIEHIHIKDKNTKNENVLLGTGLVNFLYLFKALKKINYIKSYTFETTRGLNPKKTCEFNMNFINYFCEETVNEF